MVMATNRKVVNSMDALAASPQPHMEETADVTEASVDRVWNALNDKRYNWRTLEGLARDAHLPESKVEQILVTSLADKVIRSSSFDDKGRSLFTARARYKESRGLLGRLMTALSDQVR
jgi:hypothetical protein